MFCVFLNFLHDRSTHWHIDGRVNHVYSLPQFHWHNNKFTHWDVISGSKGQMPPLVFLTFWYCFQGLNVIFLSVVLFTVFVPSLAKHFLNQSLCWTQTRYRPSHLTPGTIFPKLTSVFSSNESWRGFDMNSLSLTHSLHVELFWSIVFYYLQTLPTVGSGTHTHTQTHTKSYALKLLEEIHMYFTQCHGKRPRFPPGWFVEL